MIMLQIDKWLVFHQTIQLLYDRLEQNWFMIFRIIKLFTFIIYK